MELAAKISASSSRYFRCRFIVMWCWRQLCRECFIINKDENIFRLSLPKSWRPINGIHLKGMSTLRLNGDHCRRISGNERWHFGNTPAWYALIAFRYNSLRLTPKATSPIYEHTDIKIKCHHWSIRKSCWFAAALMSARTTRGLAQYRWSSENTNRRDTDECSLADIK